MMLKPVKCRTVLWYLVFCGMIVFVTMLNNINVAIIAMVKEPRVIKPTDCGMVKAISNATHTSGFSSVHDEGATTVSNHSRFEWDELQQGLILGAPFWLYSIVQIPAGIMARNYSAKLMFGVPHLICALLAFIVPSAAYHSFSAIFALRLIHGFFAGFTSPSIHAMVSKWIPPDERSHFMTVAIASALAIALVYPFFGWVIEISRWENVFYLTGGTAVLWYIFWHFFMYDSPAVHPRITEKERDHIQEKLGNTSKDGKMPTPWRKILTNKQVWLNVLVNFSYGFIFMLHTTYSPMYFKAVHGADLKECTLITGIPHLVRFIMALFVGKLADLVIKKGLISRTNVRKFASSMCTVGAGVTFIVVAAIGCNFKLSVVLFTIIVATSAFPNAGFYASTVDISPNFACIIYSISSTITAIGQILVTVLVGWMIEGDQSNENWQKIFLITSAIGIIPGLVYITFGSAKVQPFNFPEEAEKGIEVPLRERQPEQEEKSEKSPLADGDVEGRDWEENKESGTSADGRRSPVAA